MSPFLLPVVAVVAGAISFSSPCCLPLLPGYVSYISAPPTSALGTREARATTLRASVAFVAGFTVVFTALGVASAFFGSFVLRVLPTIVRVMGVSIIVLGLSMMGVLSRLWTCSRPIEPLMMAEIVALDVDRRPGWS